MNGYIFLHKKIVDSEVWNKPHLYLKVWEYLLINTCYQDTPDLKRGQVRVTIKEIQDACTYRVGYRIEKPTDREIRKILAWFCEPKIDKYEGTTKCMMKCLTKGESGNVYEVCNFNDYQASQNDEVSYERRCESTTKGYLPLYKENKELKNIKNNTLNNNTNTNINTLCTPKHENGFVKPSVEEVQEYINLKGYHFDAEDFVAFYNSNGWKIGRNPMKSWQGACRTWESRHKPIKEEQF